MTVDLLAEVRQAADTKAAADATRDTAVRRAVKAGHTHRAVGEAAGITHAGVKKIVDRA